MGLLSGLRAPAGKLTAVARCNLVGIVGSEELLGNRYVVFRIRFHLCAPWGSLFLGSLWPSIQTTG